MPSAGRGRRGRARRGPAPASLGRIRQADVDCAVTGIPVRRRRSNERRRHAPRARPRSHRSGSGIRPRHRRRVLRAVNRAEGEMPGAPVVRMRRAVAAGKAGSRRTKTISPIPPRSSKRRTRAGEARAAAGRNPRATDRRSGAPVMKGAIGLLPETGGERRDRTAAATDARTAPGRPTSTPRRHAIFQDGDRPRGAPEAGAVETPPRALRRRPATEDTPSGCIFRLTAATPFA